MSALWVLILMSWNVSAAAAEVVFEGQPVYNIRVSVNGFSADERAAAVSKRLSGLKGAGPDELAALRLEDSEGMTLGLLGEETLFTTTSTDAKAEGLAREALAQARLESIRRVLGDWSQANRWQTLGWSLLSSALFLGGLLLGLHYLGRLARKGQLAFLGGAVGLPGLRIKGLELLTEVRLRALLAAAVGWVRGAGSLLLLYAAASGILGSFAATRPISRNLLHYVSDPLYQVWRAFVEFVPNLLFIAVGSLIIYYALKVIRLVFREIGNGTLDIAGFETEWAEPTYKIVRFLVLVLGVVILAPYLPGAQSPAFQGVSIFLGLLISLSSSSALSNIISGVILIYTGNLRPGDRVKIGDCVGVVTERTLLVTRIRTPKNVNVTIPNAQVLAGKIENESPRGGQGPRILHTTITIGYDVPWPQVQALLLESVKALPGSLAEPAPFVLQTSLDDFYVAYQLNFATDQPETQERVLSAVHARIQEAFARAGVEILSPHYEARRNGDPTTVPKLGG